MNQFQRSEVESGRRSYAAQNRLNVGSAEPDERDLKGVFVAGKFVSSIGVALGAFLAPVMAMARKMLGNANETSRVRMITSPAVPSK